MKWRNFGTSRTNTAKRARRVYVSLCTLGSLLLSCRRSGVRLMFELMFGLMLVTIAIECYRAEVEPLHEFYTLRIFFLLGLAYRAKYVAVFLRSSVKFDI